MNNIRHNKLLMVRPKLKVYMKPGEEGEREDTTATITSTRGQ